MDITTFRAAFPEFANPVTYPDAYIQFWLNAAPNWISAQAWGASYDLGTGLWVAHQVKLSGPVNAAGMVTPASGGLVSAKSIKDLSLSYDTKTGTIEGAGPFNLTTYGTRFYAFAQMIGAGCIQLGAELAGLGGPNGGGNIYDTTPYPWGPNGF